MKSVGWFAIGGIGLAVALGGGYRATSSCIIGVQGTRASVTIHGLAASFRCGSLVQGHNEYYVRTEPVIEPVLCEGDKGRLHYIVHDDGMLVLVGRMLCADLLQNGGQQRSP